MITRQDVAQKLNDYLQHRLTLEDLSEWAASAMFNEDFDTADFENIRDIISRIGFADAHAFGLTWGDCEDFLTRLGYKVRLDVEPAR
jgi:UDP-glucose 4-epimerase